MSILAHIGKAFTTGFMKKIGLVFATPLYWLFGRLLPDVEYTSEGVFVCLRDVDDRVRGRMEAYLSIMPVLIGTVVANNVSQLPGEVGVGATVVVIVWLAGVLGQLNNVKFVDLEWGEAA